MRRTAVSLLIACGLAGGVGLPVSALAHGRPDVPPGQAKKQQDAAAAPDVSADQPASGVTDTAGAPAEVAPEPISTPVPSAGSPAGSVTDGPRVKKIPPGQLKKLVTATPVATAVPTAAPVVAAPSGTTAAAATPSAATPVSSRGSVHGRGTAKVRLGAKAKTRRSATAGPRAASTTTTAAARRAAARRTGATPAAAPAAGTGASAAAKPPHRKAAAKPRPRTRVVTRTRTLTERVEHVVHVIPAPLRTGLLTLGGLAALLVLALAAAWLRARRLERQRRRLVEDVGLLQSALLPELDGTVGPATVSAAYRPAEGLAAGGDFYDCFALDEHRTAIVVGDVAGHGRDAIPLTASVRYTVRAYLEGGLGPRHTLQVAGRVLEDQLHDRLVTVALAVYDDRTGLLTAACAGHPPPVVSSDKDPYVLAFSSPAIGLGVPTGRRQVTVPLPPGAAACFYTDGLADVMVGADERLGLERLAEAVRELGPEDGAPQLLQRIVRRSDSQPDDMAAVVVRAPADAPSVRAGRIEELEIDATDVRRGRLAGFLAAYGVSDGVAEAATRAATDALRRAGACVIAVHHGEGGATVAVEDTPSVVALPLLGRDVGAGEPAVDEELRRGHEARLV